MELSELLTDLYGRIPPLARDVVEGLPLERLTQAPAQGANTIAWLLWHVARVQDHHVSEILGAEQLWADGTWPQRFELGADLSNTGYGHTAADVASIRPIEPAALTDYLDAAAARTAGLLAGLTASDLDRVVDKRWDPPVTLGVRLVSIADDGLQHVGQAAYVRGVLER